MTVKPEIAKFNLLDDFQRFAAIWLTHGIPSLVFGDIFPYTLFYPCTYTFTLTHITEVTTFVLRWEKDMVFDEA